MPSPDLWFHCLLDRRGRDLRVPVAREPGTQDVVCGACHVYPPELAGSCRFLAAVTALSVQIPCKKPGFFPAGAVIFYNPIDPNFKHFHKILGRSGVEALYQGEIRGGKPNLQ